MYLSPHEDIFATLNNSFQAALFNQHLIGQMSHNPDPDMPSGLISPPPGGEPVVKDEPEDEDAQNNEVSVTI